MKFQFSSIMLQSLLYLFLLLPLNEAVTIHPNCAGYGFIAEAIPYIFSAAEDAAKALQDPMNSNIADVASWLFGPDRATWATVQTVFSNLKKTPQAPAAAIGDYIMTPIADEIIIVCEKDQSRWTQLANPPAGWPDTIKYDSLTRSYVDTAGGALDRCYVPFTDAAQHQADDNPLANTANWPKRGLGFTTTDICPWYLDFVQQAAHKGSLRGSIPESLNCALINPDVSLFKTYTDVDARFLFESNLLHEFMHRASLIGTSSRDEKYGWTACVAAADATNADSLAMFATAVNLIKYCGVHIAHDGSISPGDVARQRRTLTLREVSAWAGLPWSGYKSLNATKAL